MKTYKISILAGLVLGMGALSSCSDDWNPGLEDATGSVALSSLAPDLSDAQKLMTSTSSRASVDLKDFKVNVTDLSGDGGVRSYTYSTMPEVLTLPVGNYRLDIESHEVQKAEWERPYYKGSKEFKVEAGKITNIGVVECSFASIRVSVIFSDELRKIMGDDVKVTILVNDEGTLDFTPDETRSAYFAYVNNSTTLAAHFEGTVDGNPAFDHLVFTDLEPGQHRKIIYQTKKGPGIPDQEGNIKPGGINVDSDVIVEDIDGNIVVGEENIEGKRPWGEEDPVGPGPEEPGPGPEEPGDDKAATFTPTTDNLKLAPAENDVANFPAGTEAIVNIDCPKGFAHLVVKIETSNAGFESAVSDMLPLSFDLADLDADLAASLGKPDGLGFPVNGEVVGATSAVFDITQFVPLLASFQGTHKFIITVTDSEGKAETTGLIFVKN